MGGVDDDHLMVVADDPHVLSTSQLPPSRLKVPEVTSRSTRVGITAPPPNAARHRDASARTPARRR
jgi:hypothetical protein